MAKITCKPVTKNERLRVPRGVGDDSAAATAAYLAADYDRALALVRAPAYRGNEEERSLLEARIVSRTGDPLAAVSAAVAARRAARSADARALAAALEAMGLGRAGKRPSAVRRFQEARRHAARGGPNTRAEVGYFEAFDAWSVHDMTRSEQLLDAALPDADGLVASSLIALKGWIEVRRERYDAAARHFEQALADAQRSADPKERDVRLEARLVHVLLVTAGETIDLPLARRVEQRTDEIAWSNGVARERFNTTTCRRFIALLRGDTADAYRFGEIAIAQAPDDAFRAVAHTNQYALLQAKGDKFAAGVHLEQARRIIERFHWRTADVEQRVALTNYAIEAAGADPSGASRALTMYRSISERKDSGLALQGDRRVDAFTDMAEGRVAEARGDIDRAVVAYERSVRRWTALDYRMRAAIVALDLFRLTKDMSYLDEVNGAQKRAPQAWFRIPPPPGSHPGVPQLTPALRRVLSELLRGKSSKQIAATVGRADYTVRNQTKRIYSTFGVRTRAELLARCARDGTFQDLTAQDLTA